MGLVKIRFQIINDIQFSRAFEFAMSRYADFTEPFGLMADDFFQTMTGVFEREGAFEGRVKWQELSPAYARWKTQHYPGRKILELTGRLRASLTNKGGPDNVLQITPTMLAVGTVVPYAIRHQLGLGNLPMRKIIELTADQKLRWVQILHKYMYDVNETVARITRS